MVIKNLVLPADEVGQQDLLKTLAETCQKTGWQVQAYYLMRHHLYLVVEPQRLIAKAQGMVHFGKNTLPAMFFIIPTQSA